MTDLAGKRILLTGVSRGVGLAAARLLPKSGAQVLGVARDQARLESATGELDELARGAFTSVCAELSDARTPELLAAAVRERWGAVDIVIHNAGVMLHHEGGIMGEPEGILEQSLDINLLAPFRVTRALLPFLNKGNEPRILNVGSGAGNMEAMREPGIASYRLSKWALGGLTMLQAKELAPEISVNAFDPGWVRTDLGGPQAPGTPEEAAEGLLKTLAVAWKENGNFYKDGKVIPW
jgi:NAD(P)-dependent dehydrogenase (short-subunit alcohol dehydrogenase family)